MRFANKKGFFSIIELLIVLTIIWLLYSVSIPQTGRRIPQAERKFCISKLSVLTEAVCKYNMDNAKKIERALPGGEFEDYLKTLVEKKYLKNNYLDEIDEKCSYGLITTTGSGTFAFCKIHGVIETSLSEKPFIPEYDKKLEIPFSKEYMEVINKKKKKREEKEEIKRLENDIYKVVHNPIGPIISLIIIITIAIVNKIKSKDDY